MKIADLFIGLGIRGDGEAQKGLKGVKGGLAEVKSMSLEAKAAIIGAIYALERMMSSSAKAGTGFMNFGAITGKSMQQLQQWQYAARQVGISNEEVESSVKGVQDALAGMQMGEGAIKGLDLIIQKVGFDIGKAYKDPFYALQQFQKFAQAVPANLGNQILKPLVGEGVLAAMRQNAFRPEVMKRAPTYSDKEIKNLQGVNAEWSNLNTKIQMAFGHLTAKHGFPIIKIISDATDKLMKFLDVLETKLQLFSRIIQGWSDVFGGLTKLLEGKITAGDVGKGTTDALKGMWMSAKESIVGPDYTVAPPVKTEAGGKTNNVDVNQNIHIHGADVKDAKKIADHISKVNKETYKKMPAQLQRN